MPLKALSEARRYTSVICHVSNIAQECDARGNADLPRGSKGCFGISVYQARSLEIQEKWGCRMLGWLCFL